MSECLLLGLHFRRQAWVVSARGAGSVQALTFRALASRFWWTPRLSFERVVSRGTSDHCCCPVAAVLRGQVSALRGRVSVSVHWDSHPGCCSPLGGAVFSSHVGPPVAHTNCKPWQREGFQFTVNLKGGGKWLMA